MEHSAWVILFAGLLVFFAHLFAALFDRTRIPDVLPLVLVGLVLGPVLGLVGPDALGRLAGPFTTLALVVILFEGGLDLDLDVLRRTAWAALRLAVLNVLAVGTAVSLLAWFWMGLPPVAALSLGAIAAATSPAVVVPLVRRLRVSEQARTTLVVESALTDVLCIVLVLGFLQPRELEAARVPALVGGMLSSLLMAALIGAGVGVAWSTLLERVRRLQSSMVTTPALMLVVVGLADLLGYSGAIAALAFGIVLGNTHQVERLGALLRLPGKPVPVSGPEKDFFGEMVFVVKAAFFVYVGLSIRTTDPGPLAAAAALAGLSLVLRPPVAWLGLGRRAPRFDRAVASIMVPKGLAAAVLAAAVAGSGIPGGAQVRDVANLLILFSILATTLLAFAVEKGLGGAPAGAPGTGGGQGSGGGGP